MRGCKWCRKRKDNTWSRNKRSVVEENNQEQLEQSLKKKKITVKQKDKNRNQTEALQVVTNCNTHTTMTNSLNNECSVPHSGLEQRAGPADW